jgi:hypothetical protein
MKTGMKVLIGVGSAIGLGFLFKGKSVAAAGSQVTLAMVNYGGALEQWTVQLYNKTGSMQVPLANPDENGDLSKNLNEVLQYDIPAGFTYPAKMVLVFQLGPFDVNFGLQSLGPEYAPSWGPYDAAFVLPGSGSYTIDYVTGAVTKI